VFNVFKEANERAHIVTVCESYGLELTACGEGRYKALCPLHQENTPSFHIYEDTHSFYCFGCNQGGDAVALVQKIDGCKPLDAVRRVDKICGLKLAFSRAATSEEKKAAAISDWRRKYNQQLLRNFITWEQGYFQRVCSELRTLDEYIQANRPETAEQMSADFLNALQTRERLEHICNVFTFGSMAEKTEFYKAKEYDQ
jgi:hypothetical protein